MKLGIDILGNIAILKFDRDAKQKEKKKTALEFLKKHKSVSTVLEKSDKFKGRLRTQSTRWLAGEKTKEALYKENGCLFRFNVETCYFSPRLSAERAEVASLVKKKEEVLVMFGGVAPFAIVIGKRLKELDRKIPPPPAHKMGKVFSVELGRECSKYALQNVKRNKLEGRVEIVQGDVRRVIGKNKKVSESFDRIVMARPNLKDSFLDVAFSVIKKGGIIHYYGFYKEEDKGEIKELIVKESVASGRKIGKINVKRAGDIGPYRFRYRADFRVLN